MRLLRGAAACIAVTLVGFGCLAQTPPNDDDLQTRFSMGAIDESDASFAARAHTPVYRAYLPLRVDLSRFFPLPGDQGKQGSCVGWAVGYAARAYYAQSLEHRPGQASDIPSPAYIYNAIASTPGDCNAGSAVPDALDLLKTGALSLADAPYDARYCAPPSSAERERASDFRISAWLAVSPQSPDQIKAELAQGNPVIISLKSRPAFQRLRGEAIYNSSSEPSDGRHALTLVGYDDERQAFKLINSWGLRWGSRGYGWIGYDAFVNDVPRAYVMRLARGENPSPPPPSPPPAPQPAPAPPPRPIAFDFVRCGLVNTVQSAKGLEVQGFVGTLTELKQVQERARELKAANVDVAVRPWPQCEALMTLARGLQVVDRPHIKVVRQSPETPLAAGSEFVIEIESPTTPSFLHVAYIQADGKAVNLLQAESLSLAATPPRSKLVLGDGRNGGPKFTVSAPFGEEIVVAIASHAPLFGEKRPTTETEREFLTALRAAVLARPNPSSSERIFAADYDSLMTVERKP